MLNFNSENNLIEKGFVPVAGVDEAGRGTWAGPVVAGAVSLDVKTIPKRLRLGLDDSKKLASKKRKELYQLLLDYARVGVGLSSVNEIDKLNILQATMLAMKRAVVDLGLKPGMVLVDGNHIPNWIYPSQAIIKGDRQSPSIAAASIVAKVSRDKVMADLALDYPQYGWERNAGYGTKAHRQGLAEFGICEHHRRSFKPIKNIIAV
ncbi:MAG: ribonuclease HII [Magnetovibrio sp.]|nr:ribonuclease HII [Magnetovibrio sp.]|tara:strand:+ start:1282 stop:1899 length:618 start_codon:yes stop_codon:yes gene_type:complete